MTAVEKVFSTIFCAVPAFIRVLPAGVHEDRPVCQLGQRCTGIARDQPGTGTDRPGVPTPT